MGHSDRDCNIVYRLIDKVIERVYRVWLRAPSKNAAKFNTGGRWLRSANEVNNPWMKAMNQGTTETTVHNDSREQEKFMEVDDEGRVIHGDSGGIEIQSRNSRELNIREIISTTISQK